MGATNPLNTLPPEVMAQPSEQAADDWFNSLVIDDDTPVDNRCSEQNMRLDVDSLYASWEAGAALVSDG